MAYDRYDTRDEPHDERSRWSRERHDREQSRGANRDRSGPEDRGFFERAGDEISSWFGDDDTSRRRREDSMREERERRSGSSERDYNSDWRGESSGGGGREWNERGARDYRPMTGDYGRVHHESGQFFAASGVGRNEPGRGEYRASQTPWGRDEYRSNTRAGTADQPARSRHDDPHYHSWRQRQIESLDRDYDDYRREHQSKFESDFGNWRERRQQKRGLLDQIREHMEVVGSDDEHVGTIDRAVGDRIILTKSDPESGGSHHSLSCSDLDRVEGDRVILDCTAEEARKRWRDDSRSRALFEREDQGEMGPRTLDRSFEGTYR